MRVVLLLLTWACLAATAAAALPSDFVALPAELGSRPPARLVFTAQDLAQCWNDKTARRCVVRAPIRVDEPTWRRLFASTGGVALQDAALPPLMITSEACSVRGGCLGVAPSNGSERLSHSQQQTFDLNQVPGVMKVGPNTTLSLVNLHLANVAYKTAYKRTDAQPFRTEGVGTGLWPSVQFSPGSKIIVANCSVTYTNPSAANCAEHVQRGLFTFQQVYGDRNITSVNSTTTRVVGPVYIVVAVRDGDTGKLLGNSTSIYRNVSFTCMERPNAEPRGPSGGALAAAIAVPIAVAVLVGGLLLAWYFRRRARSQGTDPKAGPSKPLTSGPVIKDVEMGGGDSQSRPASRSVASDTARGPDQARAAEAAGSMPISFAGSSMLWSTASGYTAGTQSSADGDPLVAVNSVASVQSAQQPQQPQVRHPHIGVPVQLLHGPQGSSSFGTGSGARMGWQLAQRDSRRYAHQVGSPPSLQNASSAPMNADAQGLQTAGTLESLRITPAASNGSGRQGSASTAESGTPKNSLEMQLLAAGGPASTNSSSSTAAEERRNAMYALLKARSDVAVLRDLKIGPLLGRGSYGRVYRGRWKATTVAVKIIEHYGVDAEASSGSRRISAGREMLFATSISHPNVVITYHISTMTISQRSALAKSWLADSAMPEGVDEGQDDTGEDDQEGGGSGSGSGSDSEDSSGETPPDLLETWMIMEFCERGSLERAMKLGKFKNKTTEEPDMIAIYKALLDTASGLDYLHSIGVVHGDLKTANVLLKGSTRDARGVTCKITDFGLSKVLDNENQTHISTGTYGTIVYMPKELLLSGRMTQATDIYSFGLMMWELFCGRQVMDEGLSIGQMFYMIAYQNWRPELPDSCPPGYRHVMEACWHEDPEQRPTAQQLLSRLQKLYVQAKQQKMANRSSRPGTAQRATASAAGSLAPGRPSLDSTASEPAVVGSGGAIGSPLRVSLEMEAVTAYTASQQQHMTSAQQAEHMQTMQQQSRSPRSMPGLVMFDSGRPLTGSASSEQLSSSTDKQARRSADSHGTAAEDESYEPFVHAVLHRATSLALPPRTSMQYSPQPKAAAAAAAAAAAVFAQQAAAADVVCASPHTAAAAEAAAFFAQQAAEAEAAYASAAPPAALNAAAASVAQQAADHPELAEAAFAPPPAAAPPPATPSAAVDTQFGLPEWLLAPPTDGYMPEELQQPQLKFQKGRVQLLPGGAYLDPSSYPTQPLARAEDVVTFEDLHAPSEELHLAGLYSESMHSGGLHSDVHLQNLTNSSNAMCSEGTYGDSPLFAEQSGCEFFEGFPEPTTSAAVLQQPQHGTRFQQPQPMALGLPQLDPPLLLQQAQQQQAQERSGSRHVSSLMDILPLPPGAPDFSVTQAYMDTIEWANKPEVEAAAAAAAARNLHQMRADAEAQGTLHLLPSWVRDSWLASPLQMPQQQYNEDGFAGCLPQFPDPNDPDGQDRISLYLRALDSARTPKQLLEATHAIIADAVAVDCAEDSGSSLAQRGYAALEPDAAVMVDTMMLPFGADALYTQQGCFASQHAAAAAAAGPAAPFVMFDQSTLAGAGGIAPAVMPAGGTVQGGGFRAGSGDRAGQGYSDSANLFSGSYNSNSTAQRSSRFGSSSGGATTTYGSNAYIPAMSREAAPHQQYVPAPWNSFAQDHAQQPATEQQAAVSVPSERMLGRVQPATLSGPLRMSGPAAGAAAAAAVAAAGSSTAAAVGSPPGSVDQQAAPDTRWSVVQEVAPQLVHGADSGPSTASNAASVVPGGGHSSGSFAAWAGSESEVVGMLDVVDEGGAASDEQGNGSD